MKSKTIKFKETSHKGKNKQLFVKTIKNADVHLKKSNKLGKSVVALKIGRENNETNKNYNNKIRNIQNELKIQKKFSKMGLAPATNTKYYKNLKKTNKHKYFQVEKIKDLSDFISENVNETNIDKFYSKIFEACKKFAETNHVHGDIKASNMGVRVTASGYDILFLDFDPGFVKKFNNDTQLQIGAITFMMITLITANSGLFSESSRDNYFKSVFLENFMKDFKKLSGSEPTTEIMFRSIKELETNLNNPDRTLGYLYLYYNISIGSSRLIDMIDEFNDEYNADVDYPIKKNKKLRPWYKRNLEFMDDFQYFVFNYKISKILHSY